MCIRDRALAGLAPEALMELRLSRAKAECLLRVAREVVAGDLDPVSYTHLDVYKRQILRSHH